MYLDLYFVSLLIEDCSLELHSGFLLFTLRSLISLQFDTSFLDNEDLLNDPDILNFDDAPDAFPPADTDIFYDLAIANTSDLHKSNASPSTSESGNCNKAHISQQPTSSSDGHHSGTANSSPRLHTTSAINPNNNTMQQQNTGKSIVEEDEIKRQIRMQRNRENAYLSRQRKRQQMLQLQQLSAHLRNQNDQLLGLIRRMVAENCLLRHHLGSACKAANIPVPEVPSTIQSANAAATAATATPTAQLAGSAPNLLGTATGGAAIQHPVAASMLLPQFQVTAGATQKLCNGGTMDLTLATPSAAPANNTNNQSSSSGSAPGTVATTASPAAATTTRSGRQVKKRSRTTGVSAAFLALFSLFLFAGPMMPSFNSARAFHRGTDQLALSNRPSTGGNLLSRQQRALLADEPSSFWNARRSLSEEDNGKLLAAIHSNEGYLPSTRAAPSPMRAEWRSGRTDEGKRGAALVDEIDHAVMNLMINRTLEALMKDPGTKEMPGQVLQRLQELAPAAVLLDRDITKGQSQIDEKKATKSSSKALLPWINTPASVVAAAVDKDVSPSQHHQQQQKEEEDKNPLAASTAFPILANEFFRAAGLEAPQACRKVLEFRADALQHPVRSRRSVERYVMGTYGFKGRQVGLGLSSSISSPPSSGSSSKLALPSASSDAHAVIDNMADETIDGIAASTMVRSNALIKVKNSLSAVESHGHNDAEVVEKNGDVFAIGVEEDRFHGDGVDEEVLMDEGENVLPMSVDEPTLVSILLPTVNSSSDDGKKENKLSAVDRVFVVLLHPQDKFVTYSCGLGRSVLM